MILKDHIILVVSNEPWSEIWFSKHNYAWELAKENKVYFINSPTKWKFKNLFINRFKSTRISKTLFVIDIQNRFPSSIPLFKELNDFLAAKLLKRKLFKEKGKEYILWNFTPLFLFRPRWLGKCFTIFHIVDKHWSAFYGTEQLSQGADILIIVSNEIKEEYEKFSEKSIAVGHGISDEEFFLDSEKMNMVNQEMKRYGDFGLFVGTIDHRLNFRFIEKMAFGCPDINFVFIGSMNIGENHPFFYLFKDIPNIFYSGVRHYKEIKYYIKASSFCISPMDLSVPGNNIAHHKTLPYLAQGKRVFSPSFLDYSEYSDLMTMTDDEMKLISEIKGYNNQEPGYLIDKRVELAKKSLYKTHLNKIENFINETRSSCNSK